MLAAVALANLIAGSLAMRPAAADEAAALARIRELNGVVERDEAAPGKPVVQVSLQATRASDADLAVLVELKSLQRLYLGYGTQTSDAGMVHVGRLTQLEVLQMPETAVTDDGLAHLKPLTRLKKLGLLNCKKITDRGLVHLRELRSLEDVALHGTQVTERGAAELQKLLPMAYISGGKRVLPPGAPTREMRSARLRKAYPKLPAEVLDFLSRFDGTEDGTEAALKRHAAPGADTLALTAILLENPRVLKTAKEGTLTCYTVQGKQGMAIGTYRICWSARKIRSIKQLSLRFPDSILSGK